MNYKNKKLVENLVEKHSATLVRFLSRRMKNRQDAEDIAQTAFLRLYAIDNPEKLSNAKAFLFQVAANLSIDQLRRQSLHRALLESERPCAVTDAESPSDNGDGITLEREFEARQTLAQVYRTLAELPLNVRQAFILNRSKGLSYSEIADQMGVSVSSVEKYMLEALKVLRRVLKRAESAEK